MNAYVFLGPSLSLKEAQQILDAEYLPPASQGDVYRAALKGPLIIGLVDGLFQRVPSVWHKEILWAMANGIHVLGCSSMGALRAAELQTFGMEGVGKIFARFQNGEFQDDDEVAVAHADQEMAYKCSSEAMVNIRFTVEKALSEGIIGQPSAASIIEVAKSLFYPERSYTGIIEKASIGSNSNSEFDALQKWLPTGRVDQKRNDAIEMLARIREMLSRPVLPKRIEYRLEHTRIWHVASAIPGAFADKGQGTILENELIEEMLIESIYIRAAEGALARELAVSEATRQNILVTAEQLKETGDRWRERHGLTELSAFREWLKHNGLTVEEFSKKLHGEAIYELVKQLQKLQIYARLPDYLRMNGEYERLVEKAFKKQRSLINRGLDGASPSDVGTKSEDVVSWYFQERLDRPTPANLAAYARETGFEDEVSLRRAIFREYCYLSPGIRGV